MKKLITVLVLCGLTALLPLVPKLAQAGSCYAPRYSYTPAYSPVVQTIYEPSFVAYPVPFTVAVPVVSYLYNGGGAYAPVFQAQPANPMAQVQTQAPKHAETNTTITDEQLDQLINRIENRLAGRQGSRSSPPPTAPRSDVIAILQRKLGNEQKACASCHTGANAKGGIIIFTKESVLNNDVDWYRVWDAADTGYMPPEARTNKSAALTDQEVDKLREKARESRAHR